MITQPSDFAGNYRLPQGVAPSDVAAALAQVDASLLRTFFDFETTNFITSAPTQQPATTLAAGGGGIQMRWAEVSVPYAAQSMHFSVAGFGMQKPAAKGVKPSSPALAAWAQTAELLDIYKMRLRHVATTVWGGACTVTSVTPTQVSVSLPANAAEWCRVGGALSLTASQYGFSAQGTIVAFATPVATVVISGFPGVPGDVIKYAYPFKLRVMTERPFNNIVTLYT